MYQFSDSDSVDSDKGVRYKTDSIRNKDKSRQKDSRKRDRDGRRERKPSRSRSPRHHENKRNKQKKKRNSSEDRDRERSSSSSSHKDRKRDKRHRERENKREDESPDKKNRSSKEYPESLKNLDLKSDNKSRRDCLEMSSNLDDKTSDAVDYSCVLGPALPPHLLQKDSLSNPGLIGKAGESSPNLDPKQKLLDDSSNTLQNIATNFGPNVKPDLKQKESDVSHDASTICNETKSEVIGPILPPNFQQRLIENDVYDTKIPKEPDSIVGPILPPHLLPQEKINDETESNVSHLDKSVSEVIGPALPPAFKQLANLSPEPQPPDESTNRVIGPSLPPDIRKKLEENLNVGESPEEDEVYGPVPEGENSSRAHIELEERALKMRIDQLEPEGDKQPTREQWMMTLPETKAAKFGLGPRSFRAKAGPDLSDRSSWTDTPEEKAKKKAGKVEPKIDLQKEAEMKEIRKRDKQQEAIAKKSKKHKESLVEMHQKKLKKEKDETGPSERRPFSREIDLQVNRFDEAQKKAVLKKAQLLDTRFSTGESKYL